ncbi:MAG: HAMP domain-containing sensor histidine kinase [Eubacteriales bacterium]|nr:HAMP domain-containing sensor histidine kinase [Eubacteriales bacterium]
MKKANFFHSLRFRIMIILMILGILPSIIITRVGISYYRSNAIAAKKETLREQCNVLSDLLIKENYLNDSSSQTVNSKLEFLCNIYNGRVLITDRDFKVIKDSYGVDENKIMATEMAIRCFNGEDVSYYDDTNHMLMMAVPVRSPQMKEIQGVMFVSVSGNEVRKMEQTLEQREWMIVLVIVTTAFLLAYMFSSMLVKPLLRVTKAIEDVTDGYQNEEISVPDYTETRLITDAFNKMTTRMKVLDESRQEFVSNVSHELKTPMTSMKVLADSLVGQSGVPEELYQDFLADITEEIDRENKIITDLLSLVKLDKKAATVNMEHADINHLLEAIMKRLRPIADKRNISLILDSFRPVEADVDVVKFMSAISNLVENGIKYNVDDGWVRVTLDSDHKDFFVIVADSGLGIPQEDVERIFERFFRVDKSHSREIGGTGLGLAICRGAIQMHHGTIKVESQEGVGTTFTVRIPLSYIP